MEVYVLRLGHRIGRDRRISTHVALTARAFGAKGIYFDCYDEKVFSSVRKVVENWGGDFFIEAVNWKKFLKEFDGLKVHLTMYGISLMKKIDEIKKASKVLVVVGAEKVPGEVYHMCDLNLSVGNQPHSEVAALAVFLEKVLEVVFDLKFEDAKIKVIPSERGKNVVRKGEKIFDPTF
ncbi:MAG: tRNA (cytidine(56)-2'-O)-methyltransferase [Archaeoglobaceae archaeon]|nr:tRNA (cytidine(56)-2'-O)-methyltransferase [Archaeoglobaceae archaeon]MCX8152740.1 tRNA (cytidine(56)-2'-O)-methyltransferase [Archaeoglobaceae archaeon]MDW8013447.1 tRNA (cytidine(56)-2'-O)-methyltransferase [Archaeoglobaceae archaeon]